MLALTESNQILKIEAMKISVLRIYSGSVTVRLYLPFISLCLNFNACSALSFN